MSDRRTTNARYLVGPAFALAAWAGIAGIVLASDPTQIILDRENKMKEMATDAKAINDFVQNGTGSAADVAKMAGEINAYAKMMPGWFPAGTGTGDNVGKTYAKMEIWADPAGFKAAADTLDQLSAKLQQ